MSNVKVPKGALKLQGKKYRWLNEWEARECPRCGEMVRALINTPSGAWFKHWAGQDWATVGCSHCIIRGGRHVGYVRPEYLNKEGQK